MKLILDNGKFIITIVALLVISSLSSLKTIPKAEDPVLNLPFFSIRVLAPGASPEFIEKEIVIPIENELNEISDIIEVNSIVLDGLVSIKVEANFSINVDDKLDELITNIKPLENSFPQIAREIVIQKINPLDVIIHQLSISTDVGHQEELSDHTNFLQEKFKKIEGVNQVNTQGKSEKIIQVSIDPIKLKSFGYSLQQVISSLKSRNSIVPSGKVNSSEFSITVNNYKGYSNIEEIKNSLLSIGKNQAVYLKDLADVSIVCSKKKQHITKYNGDPAQFVTITQKKHSNVEKIIEEVKLEISKYQQNLPDYIHLNTVFDQSISINEKIDSFQSNLSQGLLLVGLMVFLFLGFKNASISAIVIPLSIISGILLLHLSGYALQQISIAALIISIGLVVDDNIVIIENINRYLSMGYPIKRAITISVQEIMWPVINSSLTTVLVFYPMTQLGGRTGQYIKTLPITIIFCLIASLVLSILLTPVLAKYFINKEDKPGKLASIMNRFKNYYSSKLLLVVASPKKTIFISLLLLGASFALFKVVGVSLFPSADKPYILVDIELRKGSSIKTTESIMVQIQNEIDSVSNIKHSMMNVGHGNSKIYYNIFPKSYNEDYGQFLIKVKDGSRLAFNKTYQSLDSIFQNYSSVDIKMTELMNGPPTESPISIKVVGDQVRPIEESATLIENILQKDLEIKDVSNPMNHKKPAYSLSIDEQKMIRSGIRPDQVKQHLFTWLSGNKIDEVNLSNGEIYDVNITYGSDNKITNLDRLNIKSDYTNEYIPFSCFSSYSLEDEVPYLERFNYEKAITISADVKPGVNTLKKSKELVSIISQFRLPGSCKVVYGGEYKSSKKSFGGMLVKLLIAIIAIFAVLVLQFKSFSQPLIVLLAIPYAFIGAILAIFLAGETFSFLAFIGFTSLTGIVINNSMILVDFVNELKQEKTLKQAIIEACSLRFGPIVLTSLTTILGLIPMVISGSSLWKPLALTIIGGMISSTILVLVVVPAFIQLFSSKNKIISSNE